MSGLLSACRTNWDTVRAYLEVEALRLGERLSIHQEIASSISSPPYLLFCCSLSSRTRSDTGFIQCGTGQIHLRVRAEAPRSSLWCPIPARHAGGKRRRACSVRMGAMFTRSRCYISGCRGCMGQTFSLPWRATRGRERPFLSGSPSNLEASPSQEVRSPLEAELSLSEPFVR